MSHQVTLSNTKAFQTTNKKTEEFEDLLIRTSNQMRIIGDTFTMYIKHLERIEDKLNDIWTAVSVTEEKVE